MIENASFAVKEGGVRLDVALLLHFTSSTRAFVREAIANGDVSVIQPGGGAPSVARTKGLKLRGGETIAVRRLAEESDNQVRPDNSVKVVPVFSDDAILAFDKPTGMPVQPLSRSETGTLMNGVVARWPECAPLGDRPLMAGAIHRIDADTSGLVLVARTAQSFESMRAQFASQSVKKTYLALVEGAIAAGGTLEGELIHDPTVPFCRMVDVRRARLTRAQVAAAKPLYAATEFRPVAHTTCGNEERTLLEVVIYTGVTHQIRAQLAGAGMHIINDRLYGAFAVENQNGHCLHSLGADFIHPVSGIPVSIRTRYPAWATTDS